jgi:hypothetical protein
VIGSFVEVEVNRMETSDSPRSSDRGNSQGTEVEVVTLPSTTYPTRLEFDSQAYEELSNKFNQASEAGHINVELSDFAGDLFSFFYKRVLAHLGRLERHDAQTTLTQALDLVHHVIRMYKEATDEQIALYDEEDRRLYGEKCTGFEADLEAWEQLHQAAELERRALAGSILAQEGRFASSREVLLDARRDLETQMLKDNQAALQLSAIQATLHEVDGAIAFEAKNYATARAAFDRARHEYQKTVAALRDSAIPEEFRSNTWLLELQLLTVETRAFEMRFHQRMEGEDYENALQSARRALEHVVSAVELVQSKVPPQHHLSVQVRAEKSNWEGRVLHVLAHQDRERHEWASARARFLEAEELWVKSSNEFLELGGPVARILQESRQGFAFFATNAALRRLDHERGQAEAMRVLQAEIDTLRGSLIAALGRGVTVNANSTANSELVARVEQQAEIVQKVDAHMRATLGKLAVELDGIGSPAAHELAEEGRQLASDPSNTPRSDRVKRFLQKAAEFARTSGDIVGPIVQIIHDIQSFI